MVGGFDRGGLVPGRPERFLGAQRGEHLQGFGGELRGRVVADETFERFDRPGGVAVLLAEAGSTDKAFVGVRAVGREAQRLLPQGEGAFGIAEPREPAAELAAFAGGETVGDLELQLHSFAEAGEARVTRVEVVDQLGGGLEFMARGMQAGALEDGNSFGFAAGVSFADDGPFLDGRAFGAGFGGPGRVVHREQHDVLALSGKHVARRAGFDAPRALEAEVFRVGDGAEQERDGEDGFSEVVHASGEGLRPRSDRRRRRR